MGANFLSVFILGEHMLIYMDTHGGTKTIAPQKIGFDRMVLVWIGQLSCVFDGCRVDWIAVGCIGWLSDVLDSCRMYWIAVGCIGWPSDVLDGHRMYWMAVVRIRRVDRMAVGWIGWL